MFGATLNLPHQPKETSLTDFSLRILAFPEGATDDQLEAASLDAPVVQGLSLHAREVGPYELVLWANASGHQLHYVDNCWVRATVRGREIPAFFASCVKSEVKLNPNITPDGQYLIEAEEY